MLILKKIHFFGLLLIVPGLSTGPFIPDLIVSITGIIFIIITIKQKEFNYYKSKVFILLLIFNIYLIINSLISENIILSLESSLFYFRFIFLILSIWYAIENYEKFIKYFTNIFIITFAVITFDAYVQFFTGQNLLGFSYNDRLSGIFNDELILGSYLSRLLPLMFALLILSHNNFYIFLGIIFIFLIDVVIYLSGERLAFFNLILFTLIIFFLVEKWKFVRLISFIISMLIIFIISINSNVIYDRMILKTFNQITEKNQTLKEKNQKSVLVENKYRIFSIEHENTYLTAYKIFKDNVFFGIGSKNFREYCKKEKYNYKFGCRNHPHNMYLQLLSETGIIGFIPVFLLFIYLNLIFFKKFLNLFISNKFYISDYKICVITCIYISIFPIAPSGNIFNNWLSIIYFFLLDFYLLKKKNMIIEF